MAKNEVLTLRIEEHLGQELSRIAEVIGMTRADYLRMVLRMATNVDPQVLRRVLEDGLRAQILKM